MSLRTRLDGRSEENSSFKIKNEEGEIIAEIVLVDRSGATLEIATIDGLYIEKPTGWKSKSEGDAQC